MTFAGEVVKVVVLQVAWEDVTIHAKPDVINCVVQHAKQVVQETANLTVVMDVQVPVLEVVLVHVLAQRKVHVTVVVMPVCHRVKEDAREVVVLGVMVHANQAAKVPVPLRVQGDVIVVVKVHVNLDVRGPVRVVEEIAVVNVRVVDLVALALVGEQ